MDYVSLTIKKFTDDFAGNVLAFARSPTLYAEQNQIGTRRRGSVCAPGIGRSGLRSAIRTLRVAGTARYEQRQYAEGPHFGFSASAAARHS